MDANCELSLNPLHRGPWTDEAVEQHKQMGFQGGWGVMADQLKALCEA